MKYSIAASLLIAGAYAQFNPTTAIEDLTTQANALDGEVNSYNGGEATALESASDSLVSSLEEYDTQVNAAAPFDQNTALSLAGPVQSLGTAVTTAVDDLVAKKPTFVSSGQGARVYSALVAQASASNQFSTDLVAKVPSALQGIAANLAAPISSALASGVSAFADATSAVSSSSATETSSTEASSTESSSSSSPSTTESSSATETGSSSGSTSTAIVVLPSTSITSVASTGGVTPTSTPISPPISTGAADRAALSGGVAALAFLGALAL